MQRKVSEPSHRNKNARWHKEKQDGDRRGSLSLRSTNPAPDERSETKKERETRHRLSRQEQPAAVLQHHQALGNLRERSRSPQGQLIILQEDSTKATKSRFFYFARNKKDATKRPERFALPKNYFRKGCSSHPGIGGDL